MDNAYPPSGQGMPQQENPSPQEPNRPEEQPPYQTAAPDGQAPYQQAPYQQPPYPQGPYPQPPYQQPYTPPPQRRNLVMYIILTILTCGIFGFYWLYALATDTQKLTQDPTAPSGGMVVILSLITCGIYEFYWAYKEGETIDALFDARGIPHSSYRSILYMVLSILGLSVVAYALMQDDLNKLY